MPSPPSFFTSFSLFNTDNRGSLYSQPSASVSGISLSKTVSAALSSALPFTYQSYLFPMANLAPASVSRNPTSLRCSLPSSTVFRISPKIFRLECQLEEIERTQLNLSASSSRKSQDLKMKAAQEPPAVTTKEIRREKFKTAAEKQDENELFDELKDRFLSFKRNKYLGDLEKYGNLAKGQAPKFMVIACGDSRVCPSVILGFEPGEAFIIRNIANLVPPFESGPTETNAALEFAVNALQVENILIIGHSCCGGIRALMSLQEGNEADDSSSSFIKSWVSVGKNARANTKAAASHLSFDQQCRHCEKESVNRSLSHLLTYPWIEEKVMRGTLSLHGGYYDFIDCTFEKWTLDYIGTAGHAVKNRSFWR